MQEPRDAGDAAMNFSLATADRTTHLRIVVVALLATLAVLIVGIAARPQADAGASAQVVKAGKLLLASGTTGNAIR